MSAHTPGGWVAKCVGGSNSGPDRVEVYEIVTNDGHRCIAESAVEPDARLIAAAPELLAALEEMLPIFVSWDEGGSDTRLTIQKARAAIAKAAA